MATHSTAIQNLKEAYRRVMDRVADAASRTGRKPEDVSVVAVTKNASENQVRGLVEIGHIDLGENRAQQLGHRIAQLKAHFEPNGTSASTHTEPRQMHASPNVRWHMIGHLQRNKVKQVVPLAYLIHSLDSLRLAEALHDTATDQERDIDILVQVNASAETSKFGVAVSLARPLIEQISAMSHIRLRGLMTIAPYCQNPEDARPTFARTAELFHEICDSNFADNTFNILSMGMTNDYPVAIEQGANLIRIGRALFGAN